VCFIVMVMFYYFILLSMFYAHVLGSLLLGGALCLVCVHVHQAFVICCTHLGGARPIHVDLFSLTLVLSSNTKKGEIERAFSCKIYFLGVCCQYLGI
jgi:hypothetical protein